jgi:hypothetical protein
MRQATLSAAADLRRLLKSHLARVAARRDRNGQWRTGTPAVGFACATLALCLAAPAALALPPNGSGNYTQIICANPSTEEGLGITGMPEGLTNPASIDTWQITTSEVDCASGRMTPDHGVPMAVGQGNTYPQGTWSALLYQAPANVTINGGTIYRAERAEGPDNGYMGINQQGGEYSQLYSLPRNGSDQGDWYVGNIASRGTFSWAFSPENIVNLTISPDGGHWDINATCDPNGNNNSSCSLTAGQWEYRIFGGDISLHAPNDPQASNITGSLTNEAPLRGSDSVTFSATDQGPGLAYLKMLVDGETIQSQTIDSNDGHCIPVPGTDAYTWAYQVPCKTSVGGHTYELNTTLLKDGPHHVQVIIEDAAGNQSIVLDRTVDTDNAPANTTPPAIIAASQPSAGATLATTAGTWSTPAGTGASSYSYQWQDCDAQGENCQTIPGAEASSYTSTGSDVGQSLRALVAATDNDGSTSLASAASAVIAVPPAPTQPTQGPLQTLPGPGSDTPTIQTTAGATSAAASAAASAELQLTSPAKVTRPYNTSALTITGTLKTTQGEPIGAANLDILEAAGSEGQPKIIAHTTTGSDGAFTIHVPDGPSRTITAAYPASGGGYSTQAAATETVNAGVQLHITPMHTSPSGTITITGTIAGPIPHPGVLVELLVHYRGAWVPFRTPRTTAAGRFKTLYQFQGATGRFPFRALVPAGQAGYPYNGGYSNTITVRSD